MSEGTISEELATHETCGTECAHPIHEVSTVGSEPVPEKTAHQLAMEEMERQNDERMEKIVITAREKLLPFLTRKNRSVEESKRVMQSMAVTIQQGLFQLMKTNNVDVLNLREKVNESYPDYEQFIELIDLMEPETLEYAIEALQWMGSKIEKVVSDENKARLFEDLKLDF